MELGVIHVNDIKFSAGEGVYFFTFNRISEQDFDENTFTFSIFCVFDV
jgi:hypothetical protein